MTKRYYSTFFLQDSAGTNRARGIVEFEAKNPKHAARKTKAGLGGLHERIPTEYQGFLVEMGLTVYDSLDEVPESGLTSVGLVSLIE